MELHQIIGAIPALNKLGKVDLPLSDAYKLQKMTAALQPDIAFFNEHNAKIIEKYGGVSTDNGRVNFPPEEASKAQAEFNELLLLDVQSEIKNICVIKIPITDNITISSNDISALEPFVEFVDNNIEIEEEN